mmetsp:Transcript_61906/g.145067  ORF Transcript_61906/g.145067 Transcript_61906/m.145067 type:complete len:623 (+) Transcript_61906:28-1896(+)
MRHSKGSNQSFNDPMTGAVESLASLRADIVASQKQILRKLDTELEKMKKSTPPARPSFREAHEFVPGPPQPLSPLTPTRAWGPEGRTDTTNTMMTKPNLPGALDSEDDAPADPRTTLSQLWSVAEQRKKRMPWINKQKAAGAGTTAIEKHMTQKELAEEHVQGTGSQPVAFEEEDKRVFSQLNSEYAVEQLRKNAVAQFRAQSKLPQESCWTKIVNSPYFERVGLAMIYLNAIWIALDIQFNKAPTVLEAEAGFIAAEVFFLVYFSAELLFRYMSYPTTRQAFKDPWFWFDLLLVVIMVVETWLIPIFDLIITGFADAGNGMGRSASAFRTVRVLRVLRTARIIRVARYMPELMILIKGLMVAARSVFFTLVLLLLVTYVFSIAITQLAAGTGTKMEAEQFPNALVTVLNLIIVSTMPDQKDYYEMVRDEGDWFMALLFLVFVMFSSLIVMNMLVGVLVEAVQTVATVEHEQIHIDFAKRVLWEMLDSGGADEDGDNLISEQEFLKLLETPEASKALNRLGVDNVAAVEYGSLLFEDGQPLTFGEFLEGMLLLRGSNQTTVKDIVNLRKYASDEFSHLHVVLAELCKVLAGQQSAPLQATAKLLQEKIDAYEKVGSIHADEV